LRVRNIPALRKAGIFLHIIAVHGGGALLLLFIIPAQLSTAAAQYTLTHVEISHLNMKYENV
jgi:hypothetical protein